MPKNHPQRNRILYLIDKCHKRLSEKLERQAPKAAEEAAAEPHLPDETQTDDEAILSYATQLQKRSRHVLPITKKNLGKHSSKKNNSKGMSSTTSKKCSAKEASNTSKKKEASKTNTSVKLKTPKKASTHNAKLAQTSFL